MKIIVILSMPRCGSSFLSQLLEGDKSIALRLSPFFSHTYREMSYSIRNECDVRAWYEALLESDDEFITQAMRKKTGEFPNAGLHNKSKRILYIKDTRNFFDYVRLFFITDSINIIFLTRELPSQLCSWINSPEWKDLEKNAKNLMFAEERKSIEENPADEYWGIADHLYFKRLTKDFLNKFPSRCMRIKYEQIVDGEFEPLLTLDQDLNLEQLKSQFANLTTTGNRVKTAYSVYREKGYTGKKITLGELPSGLINSILND